VCVCVCARVCVCVCLASTSDSHYILNKQPTTNLHITIERYVTSEFLSASVILRCDAVQFGTELQVFLSPFLKLQTDPYISLLTFRQSAAWWDTHSEFHGRQMKQLHAIFATVPNTDPAQCSPSVRHIVFHFLPPYDHRNVLWLHFDRCTKILTAPSQCRLFEEYLNWTPQHEVRIHVHYLSQNYNKPANVHTT